MYTLCLDLYMSGINQKKLKAKAYSMSAHTFPPEGPISSGET